MNHSLVRVPKGVLVTGEAQNSAKRKKNDQGPAVLPHETVQLDFGFSSSLLVSFPFALVGLFAL